MKYLIVVSASIILTLSLYACGQTPEETTESITEQITSAEEHETTENDSLPVFTLEELALYDGQEGRSAYVAVNGFVYDVTEVSAWAGGNHFSNQAGKDLTDVIENDSPHGLRVLENLTIVGRLE